MGAALCLIAYLGIRRLDDKNKEKIEHLSALLKVYQDEIKALDAKDAGTAGKSLLE